MNARTRTTPPGGGHTADSDVPPMPHTDFIITKAGAFTAKAVEDLVARLEAAANRTASLERELEEARLETREQAGDTLDALEQVVAAEAERDAALKDVETVGEDLDHYRLLCIKAEAERDAAHAALRQAHAALRQALNCTGHWGAGLTEPAICRECQAVARAVLGGPE